jgi:hypothetical protein
VRPRAEDSNLGGGFFDADNARGAPSFVRVVCAVDDMRTIAECSKTIALDHTVVGEDILTLGADDESVAFSWVKPLNDTLNVSKFLMRHGNTPIVSSGSRFRSVWPHHENR